MRILKILLILIIISIPSSILAARIFDEKLEGAGYEEAGWTETCLTIGNSALTIGNSVLIIEGS